MPSESNEFDSSYANWWEGLPSCDYHAKWSLGRNIVNCPDCARRLPSLLHASDISCLNVRCDWPEETACTSIILSTRIHPGTTAFERSIFHTSAAKGPKPPPLPWWKRLWNRIRGAK